MAFLQPILTRTATLAWTACVVGCWVATPSWSQEGGGWALDRHTVILGADSDRVYLGMAPEGLALNEAVREEWSVFSAPRLGGALVEEQLRPLNVEAWQGLNGIQHVAMHPDGGMALISARRLGDDCDLFVSHRAKSRVPGGRESWSAPMPLDGLNTEADEVFPHWEGRDVAFASNRTGSFALYTARAATQWLRSELFSEVAEDASDVLSAVTVGPGWTWVSRRQSFREPVSVVREFWPKPESTLESGWSVCVLSQGLEVANQVLVVRDPATRNVTSLLETNREGCASLDGLPSDQVWTLQWKRVPELELAGPLEVEVRAPDGRVVRRYTLSAEGGWELVFLPLDPVAELRDLQGSDGSDWPSLALSVLNYDLGQTIPTTDSWQPFLGWVKACRSNPEQGSFFVTGHTDASGTEEHNALLSQARANHVAMHLTTNLNWPTERVVVRAVGSSQPLGDNPAQNRRVEVRWVPAMQ